MNELKLSELCAEGQALLDEAHKMMAHAHNDALRKREKTIPTRLTDDDKKLNVVFVGPYSVGKSTIVSLLTGKHLSTGAAITTDHTTTIDWHGIAVTDTPGIHTGIRADHDSISYDAISKADLLVFVVSQKGFTQDLADHFHALAEDRKKGPEMMLVVNKMDMSGNGNTPEMQDITFEGNIAGAVAPLTRKGLYTSFMIARYWEKGLTVTDPARQQEYFKRSGRDEFVANLNRFVHDRGWAGRLTTNLETLEQQLVEALAEYSDNPTVKAMKETYARQRRMLVDAKRKVQDASQMIIKQETNPVVEWGNIVAGSVTSASNQKDLENEVSQYMRRTDEVWGNAIKRLEEVIAEQNQELAGEFKDLANSNFGQQVRGMVNRQVNTHLNPKSAANMQKWGQSLNKFGGTMAKMSKGAGAAGDWQHFFRVSEASGSNMHDIVLGVGHFFGHKFVPWEATKIASRIGQVSKVLGAAGAIIGVIGQLYSDSQEEKQEAAVRDAKSTIRTAFSEVANTIELEFDKKSNMWVAENYDVAIKEVNDNVKQIEDLEKQDDKEYKALLGLRDRTRRLIGEMQNL